MFEVFPPPANETWGESKETASVSEAPGGAPAVMARERVPRRPCETCTKVAAFRV